MSGDGAPTDAGGAPPDEGARLRALYSGIGGVHRTFSAKVQDYLAARPDYPPALFELLRAHCALTADSVVADVGAGTGLLTRGLLAQGWQAVAVEPNAEMLAAARALLGHEPRFRAVAGSAEETGLAPQSVDLITAAQAFHWFDGTKAAREFRRVLRPGAAVALIWNDRDADDPLNVALDRMLDAYGGERRAQLLAHEQQRDLAPFFGAPVRSFTLTHRHKLDRSALTSLVMSRSYMPARGSDQASAVIAEIGRLVQSHGDDGIVSMRYRTQLLLGRFDRQEPG